MTHIIIEFLYLLSMSLIVITAMALIILLWWVQKHRFWAIIDRLTGLHDRVFYWCMDKLMGCKGEQER